MTIHVTQKHIDAGAPASCSRCPIALALLEALGSAGVASVAVTPSYFLLLNQAGHITGDHQTPLEARKFMAAFDSGDPVQPFSFELA